MNSLQSDLFYNRELSWIEFNKRVLSEASNDSNLLFEKLKFLAITSSNFDEFFKVRISEVETYENILNDTSGYTSKLYQEISETITKTVKSQYKIYNALEKEVKEKTSFNLKKYSELSKGELAFVQEYFVNNIEPVLTPMAIDLFRPFPYLRSSSINLIVNVKEKNGISFAILEVPKIVNRLFKLSSKNDFILLEEIIKNNLDKLFMGYEILTTSFFRITRDEDFGDIEEREGSEILLTIEEEVKNRKWGTPVRIEYSKGISTPSLEFLKEQLELEDINLYEIDGPLDLTFLWGVVGLKGFEKFKFKDNVPKYYKELEDKELYRKMKKQNILMRHPFESFNHVVDFVKVASQDPKVLAIKQTLYRVSGDSPIIHHLIEAAKNGKQVTVLVEVKARFDEERNVKWARELEKAGCHVLYGLSGLKIHCKCLLVVRKESEGIKRYVHLGTGNYNDSTAKLYVDYSFFTCDEEIGMDVSSLFNKLTGFSNIDNTHKLLIAPTYLRENLNELIDREIEIAKSGKEGKIIIKSNGLTDFKMSEKLYEASKAGVKIDLIIRGACCLKSGIKGISENIKVYSLVGRFLEHDRIYYFKNNGDEDIYLGSADCMRRNLDKRVEVLFPIEDKENKVEVIKVLKNILNDNVKLRIQNPDGSYSMMKNNKSEFNYQEETIKKLNLKY